MFVDADGKFVGSVCAIAPAWSIPDDVACTNEANRVGPEMCVWSTPNPSVSMRAWWSYIVERGYSLVCPD